MKLRHAAVKTSQIQHIIRSSDPFKIKNAYDAPVSMDIALKNVVIFLTVSAYQFFIFAAANRIDRYGIRPA